MRCAKLINYFNDSDYSNQLLCLDFTAYECRTPEEVGDCIYRDGFMK